MMRNAIVLLLAVLVASCAHSGDSVEPYTLRMMNDANGENMWVWYQRPGDPARIDHCGICVLLEGSTDYYCQPSKEIAACRKASVEADKIDNYLRDLQFESKERGPKGPTPAEPIIQHDREQRELQRHVQENIDRIKAALEPATVR